jgi:hypothetical protein
VTPKGFASRKKVRKRASRGMSTEVDIQRKLTLPISGRENRSKAPHTGGRFDAYGKYISGRTDDVRTFAAKNAHELLLRTAQHLKGCEQECSDLLERLNHLFHLLPEYQSKAA